MARFVKGQSGNPRGRPKKSQTEKNVDKLCRERSYQALETLTELLNSESDSIRLRSAQIILERGWGRPRQGIEIEQLDAPQFPTTVIFDFHDTVEDDEDEKGEKLEGT